MTKRVAKAVFGMKKKYSWWRVTTMKVKSATTSATGESITIRSMTGRLIALTIAARQLIRFMCLGTLSTRSVMK